MRDDYEFSNQQKTRRRVGADFEKRIIASCERYRAKGIARIEKVATPFKTIRKGNKMLAIPAEKSTVDFMGVARVDGEPMAIAFEAKHCSTERFSLDSVKPHQRRFMDEWMQTGGIAFVLLEMAGNVYRIDWPEYAGLEGVLGRKSIPMAWLEKQVPCPEPYHGVIDFLSAIA